MFNLSFKTSPGGNIKTNDSSALHQAVKNGDLYEIQSLIKLGHDVNIQYKGFTPLHYAVRNHDLKLVKELVKHGANPNEKGKFELGSLHYIANYKSEAANCGAITASDEDLVNILATKEAQVMTYLVSEGADINQKDAYGATPLNRATVSGNDIAAAVLLNYATNLHQNVKSPQCLLLGDKEGRTALHWAVLFNRLYILEILIRKFPSDLDRGDQKETTPLHLAATEGNIEVLRVISKRAGRKRFLEMLQLKDIYNNTCLHSAVMNKQDKVVKFLIDNGADVNCAGEQDMAALHLSAKTEAEAVLHILAQSHADVNSCNNEGRTPLHIAAMNNQLKALAFLVDRGAKLDEKDNYGLTPFLLAVKRGKEGAVKLLLKEGASYEAVDENDKNAIIIATEENRLSVIEVLLGASDVRKLVSERDCDERTAVQIAAEKGNITALQMLLDKGGRLEIKNEGLNNPLHLAANSGQKGTVREILVRQRRLLEDTNMDSNTALHLAAIKCHAHVVGELVKQGANLRARNRYRWTPLMCAAFAGSFETCSVLLKAGGSELENTIYQTRAQHLASKNGHADVLQLLIEHGANAGLRDENRKNCLDLAIANHHKHVALTIVESNQWENALRNENMYSETHRDRDTPMRKLIRTMPDVAELVLNRCLATDADPPNDVTFTYEFIDDTSGDWWNASGQEFNQGDPRPIYKTEKQNHPLSIMVEYDQDTLLHHPVVGALINYKWRKAGRNFFYAMLLLDLIFLASLTGYVITTEAPYNVNTTNTSVTGCEIAARTGMTNHSFASIAKYIIMALAVGHILKEIVHILIARTEYSWKNVIDWAAYVLSFLLVFDFEDCQKKTGYRLQWQWSLGAAALILAWMELALFIRVTRFGIYVVMLGKMFRKFKEFLIVLLLFIMAFTLGFYMLLQNQRPFVNVWDAIIKTVTMMIGELTYDDIFNSDSEILLSREVCLIVFVAFTVIMAILIMNLLIGMVVAGYEEVLGTAELQRRKLEVVRALFVEWLFRRLSCKIYRPVSSTHHGHYDITGQTVRESRKKCFRCDGSLHNHSYTEVATSAVQHSPTTCGRVWQYFFSYELSPKDVRKVMKIIHRASSDSDISSKQFDERIRTESFLMTRRGTDRMKETSREGIQIEEIKVMLNDVIGDTTSKNRRSISSRISETRF